MKMHTDNGFTFDIKEDHATVMEIDGDPQIVEIPEQIDGVPVTELAEYLFSGKSCQVIRIPLGVRKIGRYGFYNCRNLEELWFSSDFTDLGSGTFTGCHRIRRMEEEQKWLDMNLTGEQKEEEGYVTIDGQEHISDKIHNLLANVEERVYCSCSGVCLEQLKGQLKELTEKGKKVVLVTDHPFELSGAIIYVTKEKGNQIGLITDSKYVLSGEYGQESRNTCVYSGQRNFVTLFKTALANEIELIKIREGEDENE